MTVPNLHFFVQIGSSSSVCFEAECVADGEHPTLIIVGVVLAVVVTIAIVVIAAVVIPCLVSKKHQANKLVEIDS